MRRIILGLSLILTGCATTPTPPAIYHPPLPAPLQVCSIQFEVLVVDNQPFVAITYNDNITAAICEERKAAYIESLLQVVCHYRKPLDERICSRYKVETNVNNSN